MKLNDFFKIHDESKLWGYEKSKFRNFIIGSCSVIALLLCLILVQKGIELYSYLKKPDSRALISWIPFSLLIIGLHTYVSVTFYLGVAKSYKHKSFANLSGGSMLFYGFMAFICAIELIFTLSSRLNKSNTELSAMDITTLVLNIVINLSFFVSYWAVIRPTRTIYSIFVNAKKMTELNQLLTNNTEMSNMFNMMGMNIQPKEENSTNTNEEKAQIIDTKNEARKANVDKLLNLPNNQLFKIAQHLSISGYDKMSKEELANLIVDITEKSK
ncbi:Uncharacterised protein [Mycoplasmopsis bovigenitalium]|uniref:Rho termination factor N-terminal domain-containing protein n=1 Tax=Mycoplasmopsis bovigenitalium TaxID=2112 RepID=A0A449AA17_9BACT|nr:hypothetical protein [Mycoplasmopsis bovigenitalium]VEU61117.1 Uncharacterised protein [Mycoplasmopsis bovigenitalium]